MATYLLLIEDVDDLGRSGDIVSVKPGYARNFLIPSRKALVADANARRMQARLKEERAKKAEIDKQESEVLAGQIEGISLRIEVKVDPDGNLYGSVTSLDVLRLLKEEGHDLEKRSVQLPHAIKATGVHKIELKLKEGVMTNIQLQVVPEGYVEPEESPVADSVEDTSSDQ
jgi:large subunit ribosomal protein L9